MIFISLLIALVALQGIVAAPVAWAEAEPAEVTQRDPEIAETDGVAWKYTPWKYGKRDVEVDEDIDGTAWKYHPPWKYTPWKYGKRDIEIDAIDATAWKYTPWKYTPWKYGKRDVEVDEDIDGTAWKYHPPWKYNPPWKYAKRDMEVDDDIDGTPWKYHPPWKYPPWKYAEQAEGDVDAEEVHSAEQAE